jgi:hypothetical protein
MGTIEELIYLRYFNAAANTVYKINYDKAVLEDQSKVERQPLVCFCHFYEEKRLIACVYSLSPYNETPRYRILEASN